MIDPIAEPLIRLGRAAEAHLAEKLAGLDTESRLRLHAGLAVLRRVFAQPAAPARPDGRTRQARTSR